MKQNNTGNILAIILAFILLFVIIFCVLPLKTIPYTVSVVYQDVEYYPEQELYYTTETYTDPEPYEATESYTKFIPHPFPYNVAVPCGYYRTSDNRTVPQYCTGIEYYNACQQVTETRNVIKIRYVEKEKQVINQRIVQKQRQVMKLRNETKWKNVPIFNLSGE